MQNEISVIIPMYNAEKTIGACLDSVFSMLKDIKEVIVVDDCSTDSSIEAASRFPCRIIRLKDQGFPARARNIGAKEAKGKYILFVDSDVMLKDDISRKIEDGIDPGKGIIALVGIFSQSHPNRNLLSQYKNLFARYKYLILPDFISSLHTSVTAMDRESFYKVGGFNEQSRIEDVEFGESIVKKGYRIYLDKSMEVIHLKKYSLKKMLVEDFRKAAAFHNHLRAINKRKVLREGFLNDISLSLSLNMVIAPILFISLFYKPVFIILPLLIFIMINIRFWKYLNAIKGAGFTMLSMGVMFVDMNCIALGLFAGLFNRKRGMA